MTGRLLMNIAEISKMDSSEREGRMKSKELNVSLSILPDTLFLMKQQISMSMINIPFRLKGVELVYAKRCSQKFTGLHITVFRSMQGSKS